ncbi:MAG: ATP-binding cassette domain-containing protein [Planctomycetaceae bacterium]|nr:ATP-binding cassette domain-containing protein [Planctomycetaceae bacterium]
MVDSSKPLHCGRGPLAASLVSAADLAIRARGVNYAYGEGEARSQVLFENEIDIGRGEVVIMTGPSGSGKTTLLTLIGALRALQEGSLEVLGRELATLDDSGQVELRREIGFIFQHHNLFSSLSAIENVRMATGLKDGPVSEMNRRCADLLGELGLGDRLDYRPARLSGGQRQRVAIARALVNQPALVLADEPTAALDAASGETVMGLLHRMAEGPTRSTILIVTHDQRLIDRADRIVNMVGGHIVSNVCPKLMVRIVAALKMLKNLEGLSEMTLTRIAQRMEVEWRKAGEVIVREGQEGDRFYVIGMGVAEALKGGQVVRTLTVGTSFGTVTQLTHRPIEDTVRARTDLELYTFDKSDFDYVMATDASFDQRIRHLLIARQA